jgi:hypothetical protein
MYELPKYYMHCMNHLLVMYETQTGVTIGDINKYNTNELC